MSERVLVCGSIAFDTIAVFEGYFKDHILPDSIQALSVSFFVPSLRKEWGGCAGNISYTLNMLGGEPVPVGTVGGDGLDYVKRMNELGIDTGMVRVMPELFTPQCFITTDLAASQITSFHPGAMLHSADNDLSGQQAGWGIVAPDAKEGMFAHARRLNAMGVPFIFDLGQAMPLFSGEDLVEMLQLCQVLTANDYEAEVIEQRTGKTMTQIAGGLKAAVVTRGAHGSTLYRDGQEIAIAPVPAAQVLDPTGCGDAHRAGLLYGLTKGWSFEEACSLGNLMGSIKIASHGPQNHAFKRSDVQAMLKQHFGIERSL
ncbi:carbohydrate kinase family protein [Alcaligenes sp. SDU_A2]|uniref:carbohydrate kinase family protein n=1 Tax=Alcaligenes sp. SDU_A2 TaxID=3136634 RepID=UPI002BE71CC3|nr:carbohydrate kinase family protein [Alcaligenes sp.]HRL28070.1 carbohydrate kinase family protein [Alcaligenes sp.]